MTPVRDLVVMLERLLDAVQVECDRTPGREADCDCSSHVQVRAVTLEAERLLERARAS